MSLNFFNPACQEPPSTAKLFGICDDGDSTKAYTDIVNAEKWIATVKNDNEVELTFTAVDKCIINDDEYPERGRCDGMLTSKMHLYFVELKEQRKDWTQDAINQLISTLEFFMEKNDINQYRHKKLFACNKKQAHFQEIDNEFNLAFFRKYKFRIDVQAEIIIV